MTRQVVRYYRIAAAIVGVGCGVTSAAAQPSWNDTLVFGAEPFGEMNALLGKTLFKVDVLVLRVRVDSLTAARIATMSNQDSIALATIKSHDLLAEIRFLREVSLGQFLDGIDEDMRKAVRAGLLEEESYREIIAGLPTSFGFLETRKIRPRDRISYRIHADTLRTVYRDSVGTILLDQVDIGRQRRRSVVATFLAPGSSFRKRLLSLCGIPKARQRSIWQVLQQGMKRHENRQENKHVPHAHGFTWLVIQGLVPPF